MHGLRDVPGSGRGYNFSTGRGADPPVIPGFTYSMPIGKPKSSSSANRSNMQSG
jgi:hypothetical protein